MLSEQRSLYEAFQSAIKMELEGKAFYEEASKKSKSELTKAVFKELARAEEEHASTVEKIFDRFKKGEKLDNWIVKVSRTSEHSPKVFRQDLIGDAVKVKDDIEALEYAMKMEEESIRHYESMANSATHPSLKRFFLTLSYEERGHQLKIFDSIEFLKDPEYFSLLMARTTRDGG